MISGLISRFVILSFGTLYPAYASYKAVRTKNVKEYVKWMMYWIVFAFFTCIETFTDVFLSWFPFYYEIKVLLVIWLLSPATKGSSMLYKKFVHPMLTRREQEIDEYINQAKEKGYSAVLQLGSKGVNYATNVIMQTAIKVMPAASMAGTMHGSRSDYTIGTAHHNRDETDFGIGMRQTVSLDSGMSDSNYDLYPEHRQMHYEDSLDGEIMETDDNEEQIVDERERDEESDPDYVPDNRSESGRSSRTSARIKARTAIKKTKKDETKTQEAVKKPTAKRGRVRKVLKEEVDSDYFEAPETAS